MKHFWLALGLTAVLGGCASKDTLDIPEGSDVTIEKTDGVAISGRLVEVRPEQVVIEARDGQRTHVQRAQIASLKATAAPAALDGGKNRADTPLASDTVHAAEATAPTVADGPAAAVATAKAAPAAAADTPAPRDRAADDTQSARRTRAADRAPEYREVPVPAGTTLAVELTSAVASNTSHVEDPVRGTVRRAVRIDGLEAVPAGTTLIGHVTSAHPAGKVKGRASIAFRFNTIDLPGDAAREPISTAAYSRTSRATKQKDATKIGAGAGAGAIIGGILGGGSGAAKGAAIGGGAGTAVVLSTTGDEVGLPAGTPVTIHLTAPLVVRVRQ